jgi:hypothetical protein
MVAGAAVTAGLGAVAAVAAGAMAGAVAGAIAGGITGAILGEDIGDSMKMGALSGGLAGGFAGYGAASSKAVEGTKGLTGETAGESARNIDKAGAVGDAGGSKATNIALGNGDAVAQTGDMAIQAGVPNSSENIIVGANDTAVDTAVDSAANEATSQGFTVKGAAGKMLDGLTSDKGMAAMMTLGGGLLQGMGTADAAKIKAKADKEAAESNRLNLQADVSLSEPRVSLSKGWKNSQTNNVTRRRGVLHA